MLDPCDADSDCVVTGFFDCWPSPTDKHAFCEDHHRRAVIT
jgi:hypothetical protein